MFAIRLGEICIAYLASLAVDATGLENVGSARGLWSCQWPKSADLDKKRLDRAAQAKATRSG